MADLIVALDAPQPIDLLIRLYDGAGVRWFKAGAQTAASPDWSLTLRATRWNMRPAAEAKIFLDLKLADTADTCREAAKRFAEIGIAALSTYTDRATEAALQGAEGSDLQIWRITRLTDDMIPARTLSSMGHGAVCGVDDIPRYAQNGYSIICPGIRLLDQQFNGHMAIGTPQEAIERGATHLVVGRPIWQAADPVETSKLFLSLMT